MLDDLDKLNWSALKTAHGDASHIPGAIRGLIAEDKQTREMSYWKLENYVVLQSDLYEAAFYVVPFLLEILSSDIKEGRERVYDLIFEIGNGYAPKRYKIKNLDGELTSLAEACRASVIKGMEVYINEVQDKTSQAREKALDVLFSLEEKWNTVLDSLRTIYLDEQDEIFKKRVYEVLEETSFGVGE